jgi:hypothetical protein
VTRDWEGEEEQEWIMTDQQVQSYCQIRGIYFAVNNNVLHFQNT